MNKPLKRRDFPGRTSLAALATATLGACVHKENTSENASKDASVSRTMAEDKFSEELERNRQMPRDLVMKMLDKRRPSICNYPTTVTRAALLL